MAHDDGGPAYPAINKDAPGGLYSRATGMSLWDHAAIEFTKAFIMCPGSVTVRGEEFETDADLLHGGMALADAFIAERARRTKDTGG